MKIRNLLLTCLLALVSTLTNAHTLEVDGIYYNIISNTEVEVTYYGENSYSARYSGDVTIPNSVVWDGKTYNVTSIGGYAFNECSSLTSINIPYGVTSIGNYVFSNCRSLNGITIPESVASIGSGAFAFCESLESVNIPKAIKSIEDFAFTHCSSLTTINIPEGVTSIGSNAFRNCNDLTAINIPEGVTNIGDEAFSGCNMYNLKTISIPGSVTSIGRAAFAYCTHCSSIVVADDNKCYDSRNDCNAIIHTESNTLIAGCASTIIPENITSIGAYAFCGVDINGNSINIPDGITSIGDYAFSYCDLNSIAIPEKIENIGENAFDNCYLLSEIYCLAKDVPTTALNAFDNIDHSAVQLYVPSESRDAYASTAPWSQFDNIVDIESISSFVVDGICYNILDNNEVEVTYHNGNSSSAMYHGDVEIPSSVRFAGTTYSVTGIGYCAFDRCVNLTSIIIPEGITSIGMWAFSGCTSITNIVLPESIDFLNKSCFRSCSSLEEITIPEGITIIPYDAFCRCEKLERVYLPKSLKIIDTGAFSRTAIKTIDLPEGVTNIGLYCFDVCPALESIVIPSTVTSIGDYAFQSNPSLVSVTIGSGVTSIGQNVFDDCQLLSKVYCLAEIVPSTAANAFGSSPIASATLYVPKNSIEEYRSATPWNQFGTIRINPIEIQDGKFTNYANDEEKRGVAVTYTRTLPNLKWNALFVPFEIPVAEIADKYDVAYINNINSYDYDEDGVIDDMKMEIIRIKAGTLKANYPYMIKAKNDEAKSMDITLEETNLYPAVSRTIDCSSVYARHEVTGIYDRMYQSELPEGAMAISVNGAWQPIASGSYLNPFRLYMTITSRDDSPVMVDPAVLSRIRISVLGEDDTETGIEDVKTEIGEWITIILDLSGRRVQNPRKGGVYIVNGKKVVY